MSNPLTAEQRHQYEQAGYVKLGRLLEPDEVVAMQQRIDDIMLGKADVDYDRMVMQLEGDPGTYDQAGEQSRGFKKATLQHRVIYGLEYDLLFLEYLQRPIFRQICAHVYGQIDIATFRAFVMNKPARSGSNLQWHQDRWKRLDRDPLITVWTALDPCTVANGCVQIISGSHRRGVINPSSAAGFLTAEQMAEHCEGKPVEHIELASGEVAVLHNWLLHRSGVNQTDIPRRGFSVSYMDARTQDTRAPEHRMYVYDGANYPVVFGPGALEPAKLGRKTPVKK